MVYPTSKASPDDQIRDGCETLLATFRHVGTLVEMGRDLLIQRGE